MNPLAAPIPFSLCVLLIWVPRPAGQDVPAPAQSAPAVVSLRVHTPKWVGVQDNWFDDKYRHAQGAEVVVNARVVGEGDFDVEIHSSEARKTSGCSLTFHVRTNDADETTATAGGTWWTDVVMKGRPWMGHLTDIRGDLFVKKGLGPTSPVTLKFAVTAKDRELDVLLTGGVIVVLR